eukprot:333675-Chlamydomonas_euryale.AAC.2
MVWTPPPTHTSAHSGDPDQQGWGGQGAGAECGRRAAPYLPAQLPRTLPIVPAQQKREQRALNADAAHPHTFLPSCAPHAPHRPRTTKM